AEDGIRDKLVTGVQTCALPILAVVSAALGGTTETPVDPSCRRRPCLSEHNLQQLSALAAECRGLFGKPQDIEWAISGERVWLLRSEERRVGKGWRERGCAGWSR